MTTISILGLGLMGGSLGLALKKHAPGVHRKGYARRSVVREEALQIDAVDEVFEDPESAVRDADLVVLCVPIYTIPELIKKTLEHLKPGAVLTDVGSTKSVLVAQVSELLGERNAVFVGSHPIAGSEQQGLSAARDSLYERAVVVVTPVDADHPDAVARVGEFWKGLGARVSEMSAQVHDRIMASTSHLPHVMATLLAYTVGREDHPTDTGRFCGTGFRDTSRIADGSPAVWIDILESNRDAILSELEALAGHLDRLRSGLEKRDFDVVRDFLEEGRSRRRRLLSGGPGEGNPS